MGKVIVHKIENYSGLSRLAVKTVPTIKRCNLYTIDDVSIDGDAPKIFVGIYDYDMLQGGHKCNYNIWPKYIAKTGHKWYPSESLTELLLNRLGILFGLNMAESQVAMIAGQLRFLSKYFINNKKEELVHGADILAGYLNESPEYVDYIDKQNLTRELLTLQFIEDAIASQLPYEKDDIMHELMKLVIFDALVGNNDRHFFNWGVIRTINNSSQPFFSPIYDTARGLFWNDSDEKISQRLNQNVDHYIAKYCNNSKPKIGWEGEKNINHFRLFENIYKNEFYISRNEIKLLLLYPVLEKMINLVQTSFLPLMGANRVTMICKCLEYRFKVLTQLL